ncbi:hypothetical protein [Chryseobacterium sp.]|jgi:hypothetical protein|uniref:hypothetical protein n=1 Tax=Chryseobacterium sp. TaxID=1871047 RepID=UPI00284497B3|nr:hypothetical protein [Chryseobacterium sp.]MDR3025478.1 hypothetical protein [Chryseobacterium sp.]
MSETNNEENHEENQLDTNHTIYQPSENNDMASFGKPTGMESIFQELTMMAMKKKDSGLDISNLNSAQVDKLLDAMAKNEENAFAYHTKKLDVHKDIESQKISASIVGERTSRFVYIGLLVLFAVLTMIIIVWQEKHFVTWLSFVTGLAGGFGAAKIQSKPKTAALISKSEETE